MLQSTNKILQINKKVNGANFIKYKKMKAKEMNNQDKEDSLLHQSKMTDEFISSDEFEKIMGWQ